MPRAASAGGIFERISVLGDPMRCRILLLLERQELTVSELCSVLQLPQSTASRHLKMLADDGWVAARRDGTSRRYSARRDFHEPAAHQLWELVRQEIDASAAAAHDRRRLRGVLDRRRSRSQEFFAGAAARWAQMRRELFGQRFELAGLLGLLDENWTVADLGCGTGLTADWLAPYVSRVIAVDDSEAMLAAAGTRLAERTNVELRQGRLEVLPIADARLDAALLILVLHHLPDPSAVLEEAARALADGGRLVVVDMLPHEREEYRHEMGHVWLGFDEGRLTDWLTAAGFGRCRLQPLAAEPEALGPTLFVASARRRRRSQEAANGGDRGKTTQIGGGASPPTGPQGGAR